MTETERAFALQYLEDTRDRVLAFAESLTPDERNFRRSDDEWRPASLIEHITAVERLTQKMLARMLSEGQPDESRRGKGAHKDKIVLEAVPARLIKVPAPESVYPPHDCGDFDHAVEEFKSAREQTLEIVRTTDKDLRVLFAPHPFLKDLDGYQWLLMIGSHAERHVRQGEELLGRRSSAEAAG